MNKRHLILIALVLQWVFLFPVVEAQNKQTDYSLENSKVKLSVSLDQGQLASDCLAVKKGWSEHFFSKPGSVVTSADFSLNIMWTAWQAPGKIKNAENPVIFSKK